MDALRITTEFTALTSLGIARGNVARINDGRGALVRVELGKVWITQEGQTSDVCLRAGESFRIEHDGLTLISVLGNTAFAMVTVDPSPIRAETAATTLASRFWQLLGGMRAPQARRAAAPL